MEPGKYYHPRHRQAIRDACTNDAVLHALRTVPDKEFKAMRQAIFDKADLRLEEEISLLRPTVETAHQRQERYNQVQRDRAPKFKSAVQPQPTNDVAQGPNRGTGFQTHSRPVPNELKVLRKKVQRLVTTEKVLNGRSAKGLEMCPPPDTFIRGTACHVIRSPSHFANGLQKKSNRLERKDTIKPTEAVRKTTFKFPANTIQPSRERPMYSWTTYTSPLDRTSLTPRRARTYSQHCSTLGRC